MPPPIATEPTPLELLVAVELAPMAIAFGLTAVARLPTAIELVPVPALPGPIPTLLAPADCVVAGNHWLPVHRYSPGRTALAPPADVAVLLTSAPTRVPGGATAVLVNVDGGAVTWANAAPAVASDAAAQAAATALCTRLFADLRGAIRVIKVPVEPSKLRLKSFI